MIFIYYLATFLYLLLCVVLCFVILIQESKSTGMGASFGGDASESVFGTATADVLKRFTAWLAFLFLASCVVLSLWSSAITRARSSQSDPFAQETILEQ